MGVVEVLRPVGLERCRARTLEAVTLLRSGDVIVDRRTFDWDRSDVLSLLVADELGGARPAPVPISGSPLASLSLSPLTDGVCEQGGVGYGLWEPACCDGSASAGDVILSCGRRGKASEPGPLLNLGGLSDGSRKTAAPFSSWGGAGSGGPVSEDWVVGEGRGTNGKEAEPT